MDKGARTAAKLTTTEARAGSEAKETVVGLKRAEDEGGEGGGVEEERVWTGNRGGVEVIGKEGREEKIKG